MKRVEIETRTVGQAFGCEASLVDSRGKSLWTSDTYPHGQRHAAYAAAETEAKKRGLKAGE